MATSIATMSIDTFTSFFQWNITNVQTYIASKSSIISPMFTSDTTVSGQEMKWQLHISFHSLPVPASACGLCVKSQKLAVSRNQSVPTRLFVKGHLSFVKRENDDFETMFKQKSKEWIDLGNSHFGKCYGLDTGLKDYIQNDSLCAYFKLQVFLIQSPNYFVVDVPSIPTFDLPKALNDSRLNGIFTDVTLACGSSEFKVHRLVLASQSAFFKTRFEERWETEDKKVDMSDLTPQVLEAIISYVYTGACTDIDDIALDLFIAADKYQLPTLKAACEHSMLRTLSVDNAVQYLRLASSVSAERLQEQIMKFLLSNHAVRQSQQRAELDKYDPLRVEILEAWAAKALVITYYCEQTKLVHFTLLSSIAYKCQTVPSILLIHLSGGSLVMSS